MKKLSLASAIIFGLLSTQAYADNLLQVYQKAKAFDAQLKSQETAYLATLENKPQAVAAKKPQVTLSGSLGYTYQHTLRDATVFEDSSSADNVSGSYTLNVQKPIYNKVADARIQQVDASISQAYAGLEAQRQALIMRVAQAYFNFLLAQDNLEVARNEQKTTKQQLAQVQAFFNAGRSAITDLKEAQSRYDLVLASVASAQQQLDVSREALRVLSGQNYQKLRTPKANLALKMPQPNNIQSWVQTALKNNKSLQATKKAIQVAQRNIRVERAAKSPTVNLYARHTGSLTESNDSPLDPINAGVSVGVEASVPLYTGGSIDSKVRAARHSFRQAQQTFDYESRTTEQQVRSAFLAVQSNIAQARANQQAVASAEVAAKATKVGFEVGTRTATDVLTSLQNVFSARRNLAQSRYNYLLSILTLKQAAGTLAERDLQLMSRNLVLQQTSPSLAQSSSDQPIKL